VFINNFLKSLLILLLLFFVSGVYQSIDYDSKYINRSTIQIDFNNIRTPLIKRIFLNSEKFLNQFFSETEQKIIKK